MKNFAQKLLLLTILCMVISLPVYSFEFEPIIQDFTPSGINSRQNFQIINTSDKPIAVKISMVHRDMDIYGEETLPDASELFFVFPEQVIVQPQDSQTVRVQWLGAPSVTTELPFRIIAEQLPVDFKQETSGINILIAYQGAIYIIPENLDFGLEIVSVKKEKDSDNNQFLVFNLQNTGNTHMILDEPKVDLTVYSNSKVVKVITLSGEQLKGLANQNILAGKSRILSVPWPEGITSGELNATITFNPIR